MLIESVISGVPVPDVKVAVRVVCDRVKAFGQMALRPVKALGSRLSAVARQPWFFPVQVAVILGLLWLHQHGYLQVPVTVCDWARLGK
jgi:hypothetical protein